MTPRTPTPTPPPSARPGAGLRNWQLFTLAVLIWGTTWHAIVYQLREATPEFGVTLRFALAGLGILAWAAWRGQRWRLSRAEHGRVAFQGIFMYSVSYLCVYHAEKYVPSGLVAVGYSAGPLLLGLAARSLWGTPMKPRFVLGGTLGLLGVLLIFWPEFEQSRGGAHTALGAAFTLGAVLLSGVGSLAASRNARFGLPFWAALGWGMLYGAACTALIWAASGQAGAWALPTSLAWYASLAYLAVAGSAVAFACYLKLQERLGPGPASTVGVATPVLALLVSATLEAYRPGVWAFVGVALAIVGNALALGLLGARQPAAAAPPASPAPPAPPAPPVPPAPPEQRR